MSRIHNIQRWFSAEYMIETAPQQAIIDELQSLRNEVSMLRAQMSGELSEKEKLLRKFAPD